MSVRCRVEMLGGLRVLQGDREIAGFATQRTAALLAYLAYHLHQAHPREVLVETFWPGGVPPSGRNSLNTALSSLRHQLEPPGIPRGALIRSSRHTVQLNPEAVTTDVADLRSALRSAARATSTPERIQHLSDAAALYRGELLSGFYEDWVLTEQRRLADEYFDAALTLATLLEQSGDVEGAIEVARAALGHDPLREEAHGELMRLYAGSGQPVAALRQFA
ncbi:MAG: AfsR/SARP family transcriptional regulator, partial [Armatimonadota bacterium]